jgi:integrase/recombinase XerD
MGEPEIREFLLNEISIGKANSSVNKHSSALRFIFGAALASNLNCRMIPRRHDRREFPAIMSKDEIAYGAVLRLSEITHLRVQDIDSKQMRLFVHQGKDRYTLLSQRSLDLLQEYWKQYRPNLPDGYLFYGRGRNKHILTSRSVQNAFNKYKALANLPKTYTVHTLRHCFATHLIESGVDVCQIKDLLGHTFIQTTAFYLHLSNINPSIKSPLDTLPKKRGRKPKVKTDV